MQMKDRTNTPQDYAMRAGVMYSLARYYRRKRVANYEALIDRCLTIHAFCIQKLKDHYVKFVEHPNGTVEFKDDELQLLYVGKRREWANEHLSTRSKAR